MENWYGRPVFFVTDGGASIAFYREKLGFSVDWIHDEDGRPYVSQVSRYEFELILQVDAVRAGSGRVFLSLDDDQVTALREDLAKNEVTSRNTRWGMPIIEVLDPDRNELFFSLP